MAQFALYRYELKSVEGKQQDIFDNKQYNTKEDFFESFFPEAGKEFKVGEIVKEDANGEKSTLDSHKTSVEAHHEHIIVLRFQTNKKVTLKTEDWQNDPRPHHPDLRIIIDNRNEHYLIAIEKKTSIMEPDKACAIVHDWLKIKMNGSGVRFDCNPLTKTIDFWDAVHEIQRLTHDRLTSVKFCFQKEEEKKNRDKDFVSLLTQWISSFGKDASLNVNIENDEHLKTVHDDLTRMARLCYDNSNYSLEVKFLLFGIYKYGQDVKAQYGMEDSVIDDFCPHLYNGDAFNDEEPKQRLITWLNIVNEIFSDYGKPASSIKKRKIYNRI